MSKTISKELQNLMHNITVLRKNRGLTKKRMAEILDISVNTLSKIERGEFPHRLGAVTVFNIYDKFGIDAKKII